ncbi:MAG: alanine racemase [Terrimicrobiaceae bacterium]
MNDLSRTWAEIDLGAIRHNLSVARSHIDPASEVLAVIKANAYGHGALEVSRALGEQVDLLGVANLAEAVALGWTSRDIMLLSPCLPTEREAAAEADVIVTVSSFEEASAYGHLPSECRINFKVDTGMGRIGCWHEDALPELEKLLTLPRVHLHSVSTHLPSSSEDPEFTRQQLLTFSGFVAKARLLHPTFKVHALNSAGIFLHAEHSANIVRLGLSLYGIGDSKEHQSKLKPALTWKARVLLLRSLPPGRTISYGRTFTTDRTTRVATISVGYGDGYPRQASGNGATVLVGGLHCPVLGRVTMDQILVDVSHVPQVNLGAEVVLIGRQGHQEINARDLAEKASTIAWHLFTGIGPRVMRIYL